MNLSCLTPHSVNRVIRAQRTLSRFNVADHSYKTEDQGQLERALLFHSGQVFLSPVTPRASKQRQDGLLHFEGWSAPLFRTTGHPAAKRTPKKVKPEMLTDKILDGELLTVVSKRASKMKSIIDCLSVKKVRVFYHTCRKSQELI